MTRSCWEQLAYGRRRNLVGSAADLRLSIPSSSSVRNGLHICLIFLGR
ncbi:rCG36911 [Rattus norvegicus]|uniref:RCG36911 n=1 Tax=Rattus norvegicus TaxID=10116 RepID=A6HUJ4_RAT|nr:rCG36911 [Rattus norvegicus]